MEQVNVIRFKNRSPDVKLMEIRHGHDNYFCIQERQNKREEFIEIDRCDFSEMIEKDRVVVVGCDIAYIHATVT